MKPFFHRASRAHVPILMAAGLAICRAAASALTAPSPVLGVSYPVINTTTTANLVANTDKAREEIWSRRIIVGSDRLYQDNPFADNFMGRIDGAKPDPRQLKKAIVTITETEKVAGNTINVPTMAGFGGPGVAGEGNRIGAEQKIVIGNFPVKIGRFWFGVGYTSVARSETMVGGRLDKAINDGLRQLMAKKKSDDQMMRLRQAASDATYGIRNNLFPNSAGAIADLLSADVISTTVVARGGEILPGLGAMPMDTTNDSGGSLGELYTLFSTDKALVNLYTEPAYLAAHTGAGVRGDENRIFKGGFSSWMGHGIYRWINRDHGNKGPIGSPLLARAFFGAYNSGSGITTASTMPVASGTVIYGGGFTYSSADVPTPNYFEFFENAPYGFFNGDTIAAVTGTTRHVMFINSNGTFGVFPYAVNTGAAITINGAALAVGPSGKRVTTFEQGCKIVQCNILGTTYGRSLYLGAEALVCGSGSINGSTVDPQMGKRTEEHRNHDMDHGIGCEGVWGNAAVQRAGDKAYPNFLLVTHAISELGAPVIT